MRVRIHPDARPWHDLADIKASNAQLFAPAYQARCAGGLLRLMGDTVEGEFVYYDLDKWEQGEWVLYAAADPAYNRRIIEVSGLPGEEGYPRGCSSQTADHRAGHRFEPVDNAQEIRDSLPQDASVKEAVATLLRTCKGCADLYFKDS